MTIFVGQLEVMWKKTSTRSADQWSCAKYMRNVTGRTSRELADSQGKWKMTSQHLQCQGDQARALHSSKSAGKRLLNVLFIAYDFPPCDEIGGSLRSEKFIKYLPKFGWDYSVLSLSQASQTRPELYPNVTRIPSLTPWRRPYQVTPYGWLPTLWTKARRILSRTQHDLIYVTSPPFFHILVADWLRREFGLPLVVDFRDAWSLDPYMEGSRLKKFLYRRIFPLVEGHVLKRCDYFIANTSSAQRVYLKKYPSLNGRIAMLPNGFDEEDFSGYACVFWARMPEP
jgi:glycosyltransferase involved in cell wall biosynthesis